MKEQLKQHSFKIDKYSKARGGNSSFLDIYCSDCNSHILLYQKDGHGGLFRLYLDRIFEPHTLSELQFKFANKKDLSSLNCPSCRKLIATPMVYKPENRLAFNLIRGTFKKKKSTGSYPPLSEKTQNSKSGV